MEILITYKQEPAFEEALKLDNLLGAGKFRVYSTYSPKNQTTYALKIFPNTLSGVTHYNKEQVLSLLQHPNIIKYIPITCDIDVFYCLVTELAPFGAFLRFATTKAFNSESLIRTYFRQLIEGIEYLHSQGIAHLDLKLDNLVLGNDYKLKIIDFDQAQSINDTKIKCGGTTGYRPLELIQNKCTNFAAVDVYSAGVILFTLVAKEFPFYEVTGKKGTRIEPYATFVKDNHKFWADKASRQEDKSVLNDELKELLNGMMEYDPEKRMKLEEIKNSKWYQGPVVQEERIGIEMKTILNSLFVKEDVAKSTSESSECKKD